MELQLGKMSLSEGIEETWKMMKTKQKSMDETLGHVKERVSDTIGSYEAFLNTCEEKDNERNKHRSVFAKDDTFDYTVDSWRRHNKKELAVELRNMDFMPEIRKGIDVVSSVHPGLKTVMEDILVDFLRMQVHSSQVSEQTVQPLEDIRMWITGLEFEDNKNHVPPVNSRVTKLYDGVKSNLEIIKTLQEQLIKLSESYMTVSSKEFQGIQDCIAILADKEHRLKQREMPEDMTAVDKVDLGVLQQKSLDMMAEMSGVEAALKELKAKHREAEQKIAEKKDLYIYVLDMEMKNEKYERQKSVQEESGTTMEMDFLTKVFTIFDNLYTKSLAQLLQTDKSETARTTAIRSEIADMVKLSGSAIKRESGTNVDVASSDKPDKPIRCQDEQLLEKMKLFIEQLKLFRPDFSKIHKATRTNITEEITTLKQGKPNIVEKDLKDLIAKNLQSIKETLVPPNPYHKVAKGIFDVGTTIVNQYARLMSSKKVSILEGENINEEYVNALLNFVEMNAPTAIVKIQKDKPNSSSGEKKTKVKSGSTLSADTTLSVDRNSTGSRRSSSRKASDRPGPRKRKAGPPADKTVVSYSSGLPPDQSTELGRKDANKEETGALSNSSSLILDMKSDETELNTSKVNEGLLSDQKETNRYTKEGLSRSPKLNKTGAAEDNPTSLLDSSARPRDIASSRSKTSNTQVSKLTRRKKSSLKDTPSSKGEYMHKTSQKGTLSSKNECIPQTSQRRQGSKDAFTTQSSHKRTRSSKDEYIPQSKTTTNMKSGNWQNKTIENLHENPDENEKKNKKSNQNKVIEEPMPDMLKFRFIDRGVTVLENACGCLVDLDGNPLSEWQIHQLNLNGRLSCSPYLTTLGVGPRNQCLDQKKAE